MSFEEFLAAKTPPSGVGPALAALWHDARGDWARAHALAQEDEGANGCWVHAYLHRKEGDAWNAGYWYRRARKPASQAPLEEEWREIVAALLAHR